ncbi:hypothetical protein V8C40DRAFT_273859 [Trichoderma camerunense]
MRINPALPAYLYMYSVGGNRKRDTLPSRRIQQNAQVAELSPTWGSIFFKNQTIIGIGNPPLCLVCVAPALVIMGGSICGFFPKSYLGACEQASDRRNGREGFGSYSHCGTKSLGDSLFASGLEQNLTCSQPLKRALCRSDEIATWHTFVP